MNALSGVVSDVTIRNIQSYLETQRKAQAKFLAELVKMPSDNPPGDCQRHAERAAELLEPLGFAVERHQVPEELVRTKGMVSAANLDGWMYGRGVAVSKSDFATYAFALRALEASGVPLTGTVELHFTYDEEAGGEIGPKWLLDQGLTKPDYAIAAGFSYAVVTAHNGCLHLEVEVHGRSAHAAMPYTGVDALEAATHVLSQLYSWRRALGKRVSAIPGIGAPQLTVGPIRGGINTNVVPDRITFRLDRRMIPEEDPATVEQELRNDNAEAARAYPRTRVEVRRILLAEPLKPLPAGPCLCARLPSVERGPEAGIRVCLRS